MKKVFKNVAIVFLTPIIIIIMMLFMLIIFLQDIFISNEIKTEKNDFAQDD